VFGLWFLVAKIKLSPFRCSFQTASSSNKLLVTILCPHSIQGYAPIYCMLNTIKCRHPLQRHPATSIRLTVY
jgi:hypothetical protein